MISQVDGAALATGVRGTSTWQGLHRCCKAPPVLFSASFGGSYLQRVSLVMIWREINLSASALKE